VIAVVIVGGAGTRLRPLTTWLPKAMLPLANRPFLAHLFEHLRRHGVTRVRLSCGHLAATIRDAFGDGGALGVRLEYAVEPEPLGTGGGIAHAARGLAEPFLALNGDVLSELDLSALVGFHRERGSRATIALTPVDDPSRYGVVVTGADGAVEAFVEKPPRGEAPANTVNAGAYVLEPDVLDLIPPATPVSIEREVFPRLVGNGLHARVDHGRWRDIGTPESYLAANLELMPPGGLVDPAARVDREAEVRESVVGPGAVVEGGARVVRSVLREGARVEAQASAERSVVGPGRAVAAGRRVEGMIVW
jgi:mannose-1-phosphate guanylyltransferase